jgi:hypothetical protein
MEPYFDEPFYVGFQVGGFELGLLPQGESSTAGVQPLWGVADIETAFKRLPFLGAESLEPVTDVGEGIKVAAVKDPFENRFGIIKTLTSIQKKLNRIKHPGPWSIPPRATKKHQHHLRVVFSFVVL